MREAEGGDEPGIQKGRHLGNEHVGRASSQGDDLNPEGPRGTARSSSAIDGQCRAAIGPCGGEVPPVLYQRRKGLSGKHATNRISLLSPWHLICLTSTLRERYATIIHVLLQATEKYATIEEVVYHLQMPAYMVKQRQRTRDDEVAVEGCVQAVSTRLEGGDRRSIGSVKTGRWLATCTLLAG